MRNDRVWSPPVRCGEDAAEPFAPWRLHFPEGADDLGVVGRLAMHRKERFRTGVFVMCGRNGADGGVFDAPTTTARPYGRDARA